MVMGIVAGGEEMHLKKLIVGEIVTVTVNGTDREVVIRGLPMGRNTAKPYYRACDDSDCPTEFFDVDIGPNGKPFIVEGSQSTGTKQQRTAV